MMWLAVFVRPIGLTNVGASSWGWVFSGNVVANIFVFLLCPGTGGKTLEQVDYLFPRKLAVSKSPDVESMEDAKEQGEKATTEVRELE